MKYKTFAVLDTIEDGLIRQSLELGAFAGSLDGVDPDGTLFIVPGRDVVNLCERLSSDYVIDTAAVEHDELYYPNPELLMKGIASLADEFSPEIICFTHTVRNCAAAAGFAAAMKMSCVTGVESIAIDSGVVIFQRSVFNGKLLERVKPLSASLIVTVIPGAFSHEGEWRAKSGRGTVIRRELDSNAAGYTPLSVKCETDSESDIEEADVIVAAGRGIGKPENLELVKETAGLFNNSAVGASRPVCDMRWLPYRHQVGITGKTVSPGLYMACGISGSQQHVSGMKNSKCIVAVNRDPGAAIFSVADYIIVEDISLFLPAFISRYHERFGGSS